MKYGINRVSLVGYCLLLVGILLVLSQTFGGGRFDWMFNAGVTLMIAGSVLRVYGKFDREKK